MRYVAHFSVMVLAGGATSVEPITPTAFYESLGDFAAVCTEVRDDDGGMLIINAILPAREPHDDCTREHEFVSSRVSDLVNCYPGLFRREYIQ